MRDLTGAVRDDIETDTLVAAASPAQTGALGASPPAEKGPQ